MGMDGFLWFAGVVEDRKDPLKAGRVRVRCVGLHTDDLDSLPTADLPWAQVMASTDTPSMAGMGNTPPFLVEGTHVIGFFLDAATMQQPMIIGSIPGMPQENADPTFGFFEERCKLYSIPTIKIPFSEKMKLNIDDFIKKSKSADMIYLDSPNNPTGFQFTRNELKKLIKSFKGPIIIDEAYVEFADSSVVSLVKQYDNLIVVRTLSKAFGLAGLRLGYFVANKKITDIFTKIIQYPYPLNTLAIQCGILALQKSNKISSVFSLIKNERKKIIQNLRKSNAFEVFDSNANFVLFDAKGADSRVYNALIEQGISIRKLGKLGMHKGCLRVTVGTPEMNSKFLLAIRDLLE